MIEQNPKTSDKFGKKRKWLIGGGIVALLAVVTVIGLFAQTGEWFRGFTLIEMEPNVIYVDATGPIDGANGSKENPFRSIREAYNVLKAEGKAGTIKVAAGTYDLYYLAGDIFGGSPSYNLMLDGPSVNLLGGYDSDFTAQNQYSIIKGKITSDNIGGKISRFRFEVEPGQKYALKLANNTNEKMVVENNFFTGGLAKDYIVGMEGNVELKNNRFHLASSEKSVLETISGTIGRKIVENNVFYSCLSGSSTDDGIIKVGNFTAVNNNLISKSAPGTTNAIVMKNATSSLVSHNTISENDLTRAAISTDATSSQWRVSRNLIVDQAANAIRYTDEPFQIITHNAFYRTNYDPRFTGSTNGICDPKFKQNRYDNPDDYKLGAESSCINAGGSYELTPPVSRDYFGTSRPQGAAYDIGFHEFEQLVGFTPIFIPTPDYTFPQLDDPDPGQPEPEAEPDPEPEPEAEPDPEPVDEPDTVACGEWWDVRENDPEYNIWMYLCNQGIVKGHDDGSLRTEETLTRAELLTLAFRASESKNLYDVDTTAGNCFNDVQRQWFAPYICTGKQLGFIEGYPGGVAKPGNVVILAEGLKMFMGALDLNPTVDDGELWYGSMMWTAKSRNYLPYSFNHPPDIAGDRLTRRIAFNMLYRILYTLN